MYIARREVLGLDGNENHALCPSPTFSTSNLLESPCPASLIPAHYYSMIQPTASAADILSSSTDGHGSPPLPTSNAWVNPPASTTSTMHNSMVAPVTPQMTCPSNYISHSHHPPPGLGPRHPSFNTAAVCSMASNSSNDHSGSYSYSPPTNSSSVFIRSECNCPVKFSVAILCSQMANCFLFPLCKLECSPECQ